MTRCLHHANVLLVRWCRRTKLIRIHADTYVQVMRIAARRRLPAASVLREIVEAQIDHLRKEATR